MGSVSSVERYGLVIAVVVLVVSSAVAQVDSSDERDVGLWGVGMSQDDQFLVVRAAPPNALIEEHLSARLTNLVGEEAVLFGAERETVRVGPPDETPHIHSASNQIAQERANLGTHVAQVLVGVAALGHPYGPNPQAVLANVRRARVLLQALGPLRAIGLRTLGHPRLIALRNGFGRDQLFGQIIFQLAQAH